MALHGSARMLAYAARIPLESLQQNPARGIRESPKIDGASIDPKQQVLVEDPQYIETELSTWKASSPQFWAMLYLRVFSLLWLPYGSIDPGSSKVGYSRPKARPPAGVLLPKHSSVLWFWLLACCCI